jgi:hypothetical protein
VRNATKDALEETVGISKAAKILAYFEEPEN